MITVVSGLPRSGTSLMMQMLAAGGMRVQSDDVRPADVHNPRGYYEDRRVKSLEADKSWVTEAEGKALKVVSLLLYELPSKLAYRVLFMQRDLQEVLRSQQTMLAGGSVVPTPPELLTHFDRHLASLKEWLDQQTNIEVLDVDYRGVIEDPRRAADRVAEFLKLELDVAEMASVVDPSLYRQRQT